MWDEGKKATEMFPCNQVPTRFCVVFVELDHVNLLSFQLPYNLSVLIRLNFDNRIFYMRFGMRHVMRKWLDLKQKYLRILLRQN